MRIGVHRWLQACPIRFRTAIRSIRSIRSIRRERSSPCGRAVARIGSGGVDDLLDRGEAHQHRQRRHADGHLRHRRRPGALHQDPHHPVRSQQVPLRRAEEGLEGHLRRGADRRAAAHHRLHPLLDHPGDQCAGPAQGPAAWVGTGGRRLAGFPPRLDRRRRTVLRAGRGTRRPHRLHLGRRGLRRGCGRGRERPHLGRSESPRRELEGSRGNPSGWSGAPRPKSSAGTWQQRSRGREHCSRPCAGIIVGWRGDFFASSDRTGICG